MLDYFWNSHPYKKLINFVDIFGSRLSGKNLAILFSF